MSSRQPHDQRHPARERPLRDFSYGRPDHATGNSPERHPRGHRRHEPLSLTNCGSLTSTSSPSPRRPPPRRASILPSRARRRRHPVPGRHPAHRHSSRAQANPALRIDDLLISPDYVVTETDLPDGWTQVSLVCTSFDPITGQEVTRTLFSEGERRPGQPFPIAPGVERRLRHPERRPTSRVASPRRRRHSTDWAFEFTIYPVPPGETATKNATAANPTVTWQLEAGVEYTITESDEDGFINGDISCDGGTTCSHPRPATSRLLGDQHRAGRARCGPTATASFNRTIEWSLNKSVTPAEPGRRGRRGRRDVDMDSRGHETVDARAASASTARSRSPTTTASCSLCPCHLTR